MARAQAPAAGVEILRRVPYFAAVPASELRRAAARCRTRSVGAGDAVFDEGQPCPGLLVVVEGLVEIRQISLRGREQVFHAEGPGATLGGGSRPSSPTWRSVRSPSAWPGIWKPPPASPSRPAPAST